MHTSTEPTDHRQTPPARAEDQIDVLRGVPWRIYDRMVTWRGDSAGPRMAYLDGVLEIMSPTYFHEAKKSFIGRLIEAWCLDNDVEFTPVGEWTQRDETKQAGLEPDECYIFGANLAEPTRPDVAIEVNWTSGSIDKLEIYRRLGIDEVWIWQDTVLQVHLLTNGAFEVSLVSRHLPGLPLALLAQFLDHRTASQAIRGFRAALQSLR